MIEGCCFEMNGFQTRANLDIIPLGSYDILIGMDLLESHFAILDCHNKTIMCFDEDRKPIQIKDIPRPIYVRQIHPCKSISVSRWVVSYIQSMLKRHQLTKNHFLKNMHCCRSLKMYFKMYQDYHLRGILILQSIWYQERFQYPKLLIKRVHFN